MTKLATSNGAISMDREFLKATVWRLFTVEAEGRRPVAHAIVLVWIFAALAMIAFVVLGIQMVMM